MPMPSSVLCFTSLDWAGPEQTYALIQTLKRLHPDWRLVAVSERPDAAAPGIEVVQASRALFLDAACQAGGVDVVIHIDPRAVVTAPLNDLLSRLQDAEILLMARFDTPSSDPAGMEALDLHIARTGTFNLGFLAVRTQGAGAAFAAWWADRTAAFETDFAPGGYADQRWCDLAPTLFDRVAIVRTPPQGLTLPLDRPA